MKREGRIFLTAVMFLTRIPLPRNIDHSPVYMRHAPRYFPVVGWIVGSICALFFLLFSYVSTDIGILASMIAGLLVTGAFHEDGFADVCDGFGGGWTKEKILLIMKDSRIGAFGAIGLICILGSKFLLLKTFASCAFFIAGLIAAHSLSRLMPVLVMQTADYAGDTDTSKSGSMTSRRVSAGSLVTAVVLALLPFALLPWRFLLVLPAALILTWGLYRYFNRWIGGYTGDCLGAIQQATEILIYLGFVVICRHI